MSKIDLLLSHASSPLSASEVRLTDFGLGPVGTELTRLLNARNGFFCFLSALHVFPLSEASNCIGYDLETWNAQSSWREAYPSCEEGVLFFAEDVFGCQFGIARTGVLSFDAETGETTAIADTLADWADLISHESRALTGWPLAEAWQSRFGAIGVKQRLSPKVPFVLGGEFEIDNLFAVDSMESMRFRGDIARQIKEAPDGTNISIRLMP